MLRLHLQLLLPLFFLVSFSRNSLSQSPETPTISASLSLSTPIASPTSSPTSSSVSPTLNPTITSNPSMTSSALVSATPSPSALQSITASASMSNTVSATPSSSAQPTDDSHHLSTFDTVLVSLLSFLVVSCAIAAVSACIYMDNTGVRSYIRSLLGLSPLQSIDYSTLAVENSDVQNFDEEISSLEDGSRLHS